jgi:Raf kinase inhibitor-like YbhB/YbcL family protein
MGRGASFAFSIKSSAFREGNPIPTRYTCWGANISPPLEWGGAPANTRAYVLVMDNPDAPAHGRVHWVLFNIPPDTTQLAEGLSRNGVLSELGGARQGKNHLGRIGYDGPCPPPGPIRRYVFRLHALDAPLDLEMGASLEDVERALQGHSLASVKLAGTALHQGG